MSGGRGEDGLFVPEPGAAGPAVPPRRRESPLLTRNPALAILVLAVSAYLLWDFAPEVAYFFSSRDPIDLGGPGAYRLELARENRLVQIRGELAQAVPVLEGRSRAQRTVGRVAGTNLLVDRPGRGGPPVYEGRLLPARARPDYAEVAAMMKARGAPLEDRWLVLRDGERPRKRWIPLAGSAILALLVLVNLRALVKHLAS